MPTPASNPCGMGDDKGGQGSDQRRLAAATADQSKNAIRLCPIDLSPEYYCNRGNQGD